MVTLESTGIGILQIRFIDIIVSSICGKESTMSSFPHGGQIVVLGTSGKRDGV